MKAEGYGDGYLYPHDHPDAIVNQEYLPEGLDTTEFYTPKQYGFEREIQKRLDWWKKRRNQQDDPAD